MSFDDKAEEAMTIRRALQRQKLRQLVVAWMKTVNFELFSTHDRQVYESWIRDIPTEDMVSRQMPHNKWPRWVCKRAFSCTDTHGPTVINLQELADGLVRCGANAEQLVTIFLLMYDRQLLPVRIE